MTSSLRTHTLGLRGHFTVPHKLQKTADHYGLKIDRAGPDAYRLSPFEKDWDIGRFCPAHIVRDGNRFTSENLIRFLDFLHQPLRAGLEAATPLDKQQTQRVALHRLLRFATDGSVEIPRETTDELQKETAECHAKTEQAMRDADAWALHYELGHTETSQSAIPNSAYLPKEGFTLHVRRPCAAAKSQQGKAQKELNRQLWEMIDTVTAGRYKDRPLNISFSGEELIQFCSEFHRRTIDSDKVNILLLLQEVEFEEAVQKRLANVEIRARKIAISSAFYRLAEQLPETSDPKRKLKNLMQSASALTPVLDSKIMHDIWTRYHFTERNDSPLPGIGKEYASMLAVMDLYARELHLAPAQVEAIAHEFYPLLAFSEKMAGLLHDGFSKAENRMNLRYKLATMQQTFQSASMLSVSMNTERFDDPYKDTLDAVEKFIGAGRPLPLEIASAGVDTTIDFTMDVVNFIRESPKVAAAFILLAGALYAMKSGNSDAAKAANDMIMVFGDEGLQATAIDMDSLPPEARITQNWHYDMGVFGLYKHYMYDNAVVGPAQTIMDWVRMSVHWAYGQTGIPINADPVFSKTAAKVAEPIADRLFDLNIFQNASHVAFWLYMTAKGFNHGFKGAKKVFDLLSPLTDLGYGLGVTSLEKLHLKKRTLLASTLEKFGAENDSGHAAKSYEGKFRIFDLVPPAEFESCSARADNTGTRCIFKQMAKAAEARTAIERTLPKTVQAVEMGLQTGLKEKFTISASNIQPTLNALARFDMVMEHIAGQIGIEEPWYRRYLVQKSEAVTEALKAYELSGDAAALKSVLEENLQELTGAEIIFSGQSKIYEALAEHPLGEQTANHLRTEANAVFTRMKRAENIAAHKENIKKNPALVNKAKSAGLVLGTALWGGIVDTARTLGKASKPFKSRPVLIATAGMAAAAVALDMAGKGNGLSDAISSGSGGLLSGGVTTTTFLLYNFWEDVLGVHVGSGAMLLAAGAASGYAYRRLIRPSAMTCFEIIDSNKASLEKSKARENHEMATEKDAPHKKPDIHPYNGSADSGTSRSGIVTLTVNSAPLQRACLECSALSP